MASGGGAAPGGVQTLADIMGTREDAKKASDPLNDPELLTRSSSFRFQNVPGGGSVDHGGAGFSVAVGPDGDAVLGRDAAGKIILQALPGSPSGGPGVVGTTKIGSGGTSSVSSLRSRDGGHSEKTSGGAAGAFDDHEGLHHGGIDCSTEDLNREESVVASLASESHAIGGVGRFSLVSTGSQPASRNLHNPVRTASQPHIGDFPQDAVDLKPSGSFISRLLGRSPSAVGRSRSPSIVPSPRSSPSAGPGGGGGTSSPPFSRVVPTPTAAPHQHHPTTTWPHSGTLLTSTTPVVGFQNGGTASMPTGGKIRGYFRRSVSGLGDNVAMSDGLGTAAASAPSARFGSWARPGIPLTKSSSHGPLAGGHGGPHQHQQVEKQESSGASPTGSAGRRVSRLGGIGPGGFDDDLVKFHKEIGHLARRDVLHLDFVVRDDTVDADNTRVGFVRQMYHRREPSDGTPYRGRLAADSPLDQVLLKYLIRRKHRKKKRAKILKKHGSIVGELGGGELQGGRRGPASGTPPLSDIGSEEEDEALVLLNQIFSFSWFGAGRNQNRTAWFSVFSRTAVAVSLALFMLAFWSVFVPIWFLAFEDFLPDGRAPRVFYLVDFLCDLLFMMFLILQDCFQSHIEYSAKEEVMHLDYIQVGLFSVPHRVQRQGGGHASRLHSGSGGFSNKHAMDSSLVCSAVEVHAML